MSTNLLDRTRNLLTKTSETHREIAAGAGVSYWWFIKFAQGHINNPTIKNLQKVHNYLIERTEAA